MEDVRLCIGVPTNKEYCLYKFFINFIQMKRPRICNTFIFNDQPVSKCRNKIVRHAFDWGATHLLFLDDDMTFPENTVDILLGHDKDIVGLLAFKRREPYFPVIYDKNPKDPSKLVTIVNYEKGLIPVAATGAACLMIKMEVFRRIGYPWFKFEDDPEHPGEMIGEDFFFCKKAKEIGFSIYVDTLHSIGHMGMAEVNENVWRSCKEHKFGYDSRVEFDRLGNIIPPSEKIFIE